MKHEHHDEEIRDIFESMLRDVLPSRLITNFVIVAEIADEDSSELFVSMSSDLTPWTADGMLRYAQSVVSSGEFKATNGEQ
jgi:hypothetical protein